MIPDNDNSAGQPREELQELHRRVAELEAALAKSEQTRFDVQRLACIGSWGWNIRTGTVEWSEEVYRIFGLDREAFHPEIDSVMNRFHPDDRKMHEKLIEQAIANHQQHAFEARILLPDGSVRYVVSTSEGHYDERGNLTRVSGIVQDITERKQAEKERNAYISFLDTIMDQSPFAMWIADTTGTVIRTNRALRDTLNLRDEQIVGAYNVLQDDNLTEQGVMPQVKAVFEEHAPARFSIPWVGAKTGDDDFAEARDLWIDVSMFPIMQSEGHLTNVACQWIDITERKRAEEELQAHRESLEELVKQRTAELHAKNQELETFAYSVSHDLKAPLRGIDGYSRLLLEDYVDRLDEDGRLFLHNVRHAAKQMNQLIEDLLTYSRLERQALKVSRLNLHSLIQELLAERSNDINERHVNVAIDIPFEEITADAPSLMQILRNLLDNALKFTHTVAEPQIEIGGQETPDAQRLWVRDNGIGFDMHYHDRIFEIFQRLHRAEDFPGTGIGLAIVRKALERMGGRAWAESQSGAGATFYLEFRRTR
jgi:PAS domain S-box-containing protein